MRKGKLMKDKLVNLKNKVVEVIMENKRLSIIIAVALIVIIMAIILLSNRATIGNTSGNLNNSGFSVKDGNWIYYLGYNTGNSDGIYRVNSNGNKKEKIVDDCGYYLNKSGNYIYYIDAEESDLIKIKKNGKGKEVLVEDVDIAKMMVVDNWIYYFRNSTLYRIKTDGDTKQEISKKSIEKYEVVGNWIYYSYYNDGEYIIAKMKTNGEEASKIDSKAGRVFFVDGKNIYYIYENYNEEEDMTNYELYKMKTSGKNKEKIADINGNVDINTINFDENHIYYAKINENSELGIYSIKLNGKDETKIVDVKGYSTLINIHESWIYYPDENDDGNIDIYRIKLNGKDKQTLSL